VETEGLEPLLSELRALSPQDAERVGLNPRRIVRAVEILRRTGTPPAQFPKHQPKFAYRKLVLWPDWQWLEPRLQQRIEQMFAQGLVDEVRSLIQQYPQMPTALQSIGYKEVLAYLRAEYSLEQAKSEVFKATRAYAKRQYTWFRKEPGDVTYLPKGAGAAFVGCVAWFSRGPWRNDER
jgi:tRNA dimethylallyltransferase